MHFTDVKQAVSLSAWDGWPRFTLDSDVVSKTILVWSVNRLCFGLANTNISRAVKRTAGCD